MDLFQQIERLGDMIKIAKLQGGGDILKPIKMPKPPKLTDLVKGTPKPPKVIDTAPKLTTPKGGKKPLFTSEMKDNSPYNER